MACARDDLGAQAGTRARLASRQAGRRGSEDTPLSPLTLWSALLLSEQEPKFSCSLNTCTPAAHLPGGLPSPLPQAHSSPWGALQPPSSGAFPPLYGDSGGWFRASSRCLSCTRTVSVHLSRPLTPKAPLITTGSASTQKTGSLHSTGWGRGGWRVPAPGGAPGEPSPSGPRLRPLLHRPASPRRGAWAPSTDSPTTEPRPGRSGRRPFRSPEAPSHQSAVCSSDGWTYRRKERCPFPAHFYTHCIFSEDTAPHSPLKGGALGGS